MFPLHMNNLNKIMFNIYKVDCINNNTKIINSTLFVDLFILLLKLNCCCRYVYYHFKIIVSNDKSDFSHVKIIPNIP